DVSIRINSLGTSIESYNPHLNIPESKTLKLFIHNYLKQVES
ncbi:hypothetical protein LCGC14_3060630, partial [marine sediment metagenome]